jgi:transcriptional regulator with XRE-family HTH domain
VGFTSDLIIGIITDVILKIYICEAYIIYICNNYVLTMKDRIIEFLKIENKSSAQLADEIGVQPSSISHIISGRNNPSLDFVMKMLVKYPALSTDWLIFGKGQMYREPQLHDLFDSRTNVGSIAEKEQPDKKPDDSFLNQNSRAIRGSDTSKERKTGSEADKTTRIICFFNNDTYKEYFPGDE